MTYLEIECYMKKLLVRLVYALASVISLSLLCLNLYSFAVWLMERKVSFSNIAGFTALFCLFAFLIYFLISTRFVMLIKSGALFIISLFLLSFASKALFVVGIDTPQYSDYVLLLDATCDIAEGTRNYLQLPYFQLWAYQTGFPAFMSIFSKLFGGNVTALLFINCMFAAGTNVLVYCIVRLRTGEKPARVAAVIYLVFPYVFGMSSIYTNQHIATFLFYLGTYVAFRFGKSWIIAPLTAGFLIAFGNSIRPEGILFVASVAVYVLFEILKGGSDPGSMAGKLEKGKKLKRIILKAEGNSGTGSQVPPYAKGEAENNYLSNASGKIDVNEIKKSNVNRVKLVRGIVVIASYLLFINIASRIFISSGLNPNGLTNGFPLYKFAVGLNHDSNGCYSKDDVRTLLSIDDESERDAEALRLIRERLSVPVTSFIRLFKNKASVVWTAKWRYPAFNGINNDSAFDLHLLRISVGRLNTAMTFFDYLIYLLCFLATSVSSLLTSVGKRDAASPFFMILFVSAFAVYLLIEVQYRYAYVAMPALLIWAAEGIGASFGGLFNGKPGSIKADDDLRPDTNL